MAGRGEWWDVEQGVIIVIGDDDNEFPYEFKDDHIEDAVAKMALRGDEDAVAAVLECPEDDFLMLALSDLQEWGNY